MFQQPASLSKQQQAQPFLDHWQHPQCHWDDDKWIEHQRKQFLHLNHKSEISHKKKKSMRLFERLF